MPSLGQRLREERLARGMTIEEIAARTRINAQYFTALEADDTESIPGGFFYRSFLRQYARVLGLPSAVIDAELQRSLEAEIEHADRREREPGRRRIDLPPLPTGRVALVRERRKLISGSLLLVAVLAVSSGAYFLWTRWEAGLWQASPASAPAPAPTPTPEPIRLSSATPEQPTTDPAPTVVTPTPTPAPAPTPPPAAATVALAPASGPVRVTLAAREDAWVQVTVDGRRPFSELLRAGEKREWGAQSLLRLRVGNAGGVDLTWNGTPQPPLGPAGATRTYEFDATSARLIRTPRPTEVP